jgi:hypothetical protein
MKTVFILSIFILSFINANAQAPGIEWQKCLGGSALDEANSIFQTQDGGYIMAGNSNSNDGDVSGNHGFDDYWIVKLDALGNINWQKSLGGSGYDRATSIIQTQDGDYIVAGYTHSNDGDVSGNNGIADSWIVKLDSLGNIIWQKSLGGSNWDATSSIIQTQDGGYIFAGASGSIDGDVSGNHGGRDYWIVKLDALGGISWQKSLGGSGNDDALSIIQTQDGGYIVAGVSPSNDGDVSGNNGDEDYWIVKLDALGDITWQKSLGGSSSDYANSITQTQDGGYIVAGGSHSNDGNVIGNHGLFDYWIVKLDTLGNISWKKSLGGNADDLAHSITQAQDGGYIVAGTAISNDGDVIGSHGNYDYWIVKLDDLGNTSWQKSLGGTEWDECRSITQTQDMGYIVVGTTQSDDSDVSGNHGVEDYWIVKLAPDSMASGTNQNIPSLTSLTLYPNPVSEMLTLELEGKTQENYQIFDLQGKVVLQGVLNQGKNLVNIAGLAKGSYVIRTESTGMPFEVVR